MKRQKKVIKTLKSIIIFFMSSTGLYFLISGYLNWLDGVASLQITNLEYRGNDLITDAELHDITGIESVEHMTDVSLVSIDKRIRANPFIESVKVTRSFPGSIMMEIKEKEPIALLRVDQKLYCIDRFGMVLQSRPGRLYNLPILSGDFKGGVSIGKKAQSPYLTQGLNFLNMIMAERPELYSEISEIVAAGDDEIVAYTNKGGIPIKFGEQRFAYKIHCLDAILDKMEIENSFKNVKYIDLRYHNQVILGMRI